MNHIYKCAAYFHNEKKNPLKHNAHRSDLICEIQRCYTYPLSEKE